MSRVVVLGLGNLIQNDEGAGLAVLEKLRQRLGNKTPVELLDGGTLGLDLLVIIEECSHLLVLDAVDAGMPPGSVVELTKEQIPLFSSVKLSQHQVSLQEVLALASLRGTLPHSLHLVGIQPENISLGMTLSAPVSAALEEAVQRCEAVLDIWLKEIASL
jgi:hydrogenase maturation protease